MVTVLFADVIRSMEIASLLDPERLREIMTELFSRSGVVVRHYGGTVDKFTGDGIMALFGAPMALEDHAFRACLAALEIQEETRRVAAEVERLDGVALNLRIGLNSGLVIAGEIGSSPLSYTAIGEHVGMAQRMESVAPSGGVMLSASTARLVEDTVVLGDPKLVYLKGNGAPVPARHLLSIASDRGRMGRRESTLVGRAGELAALVDTLEQSIDGNGRVVCVIGDPGIGKSRVAGELATIAVSGGIDVIATYCESHASEVPFLVLARLLRSAFGLGQLENDSARARVRARFPEADVQDLLLLHDLLGIRDISVALPDINPDARRRRLAHLLQNASAARDVPTLYVIEDAHWIDEASESMFAEFVAVGPQTRSMVLITYRPEYRGALARSPNAQAITLGPLDDEHSSALIGELMGSHPSVAALAAEIAERAAGNPFFTEEIVRDLAERHVLEGDRGDYRCSSDIAAVTVPATLQATIAARIDRLNVAVKRALNAAAVIGSRFDAELLALVVDGDSAIAELLEAELIDQVTFAARPEYAFRNPMLRTVAYESQLKSGRSVLHRRLAALIQQRDPLLGDENAALIATHLEAAGDLREAFGWHMRAGTWSTNRDISAARASWCRARRVADQLPTDEPDHMAMRIAPRALLCGSAWRVGGTVEETGFVELRELCTATGDRRSLVIGMSGLLVALTNRDMYRAASQLASEYTDLIESIGDPPMTVALSSVAILAKYEAGEMAEALRLSQRVIDLADGDPTMGNLIIGSPLAMAITVRGVAKACLRIPGWRADFDEGIAMARNYDSTLGVLAVAYSYGFAISIGALKPDVTAELVTAEALQIAEQSGDDLVLDLARIARGSTLVSGDGPHREVGFALLAKVRDTAMQGRFSRTAVPLVDIQIAKEMARAGDVEGAIELSRNVVDDLFETGELLYRGSATTVLVESLIRRGSVVDLQEARTAMARLTAVPTDAGFVLYDLPLLRMRGLMARASGDEGGYRDFMDRYRAMAKSVGFQGHLAIADAVD